MSDGLITLANMFVVSREEEVLKIKDEIEKITPLEYYKMNSTERMMLDLKLVNLRHSKIVDNVDDLIENIRFYKVEIKWMAKKDNETLYFKNREQIGEKFNIKPTRVSTKLNNTNELNGWILNRVNMIHVKDNKGSILDEIIL